MKRRLRFSSLVVAGLCALLVGAPRTDVRASGVAWAAGSVAADPALQSSIARVASAKSEADLAAALAEVRQRSAPDFSDLVPQLAIFLLHADGERQGMAPAVIVSRLGISPAQIVAAIAPLLDSADAALRAQLENLLGAVDHGDGGAVDLSAYRTYLAEHRSARSSGLVAYMFERSPADAAATFAALEGGEAARAKSAAAVAPVESARAELARTGRVDGETSARAVAALAALSEHPDWWLRSYAAAVIGGDKRIAELAGGAALDRLGADSDDRVRRALVAPAASKTP